MLTEKSLEQLRRVAHSYDCACRQYMQGSDVYDQLPEDLRSLPGWQAVLSGECKPVCTNDRDIKEFLAPRPGKRFLDAGCGGGLAAYRLDGWPSTYFGVDVSTEIIEAMRGFAKAHELEIGGIHWAEISEMPFEDAFFDIAAAMGVLEYATVEYAQLALGELHRVLKPEAKIVVDIPNPAHPHVQDMAKIEQYLGRPSFVHPRDAFEEMLEPLFTIVRIDGGTMMLKYFLQNTKTVQSVRR